MIVISSAITMSTYLILLCCAAALFLNDFQTTSCLTSDPTSDNDFFTRHGFVNSRVVGGEDAKPHSAPWVISMQWGALVTSHRCGGSIIAPNWVVTAGHCLLGVADIGMFVVVAGRHNLNFHESQQQRRDIIRSQTWIHERYTGGVAPYDIALIRVEPGFEYNSFVGPIELPIAGEQHTGDVQLHGWGSISTTNWPNLPDVLQTVVKPIISLKECADAFGPSPLHESNICTGPLSGGISACSGDSGGPITQQGAVIGIASWTVIPCGQANAPTVYTGVSSFIDWIENIVEHN